MPRSHARRTRPRLMALEDRTAPAVNAWLGGNADWTANPAADWSLGHVPDSTEDVRIANGATVTHGADGTPGGDVVKSIAVTGGSTLVLSGGSITDSTTLDDSGGSFQLSGGTLIGATVPAGSTIFGTGFGLGTLAGVTIAGTLDLQAASSIVVVSGGLSLPGGLIRLGNAAGSTFGQLRFAGASQTVDGTAAAPGTVLFGSNQSNGLVANDSNASPVVTYGPDLTITGAAGTVSNGSFGGRFDIQGTVAADLAAVGVTPPTAPFVLDGSGWTNHGTILAKNGANLLLTGVSSATTPAWTNAAGHTVSITGGGSLILESSGPAGPGGSGWVNAGTITDNGAAVSLRGVVSTAALGAFTRTGGSVTLKGTLNNTGATLTLTSALGPWVLDGGTVNGGTLAATPGNALVATNNFGTLNGVTLDGTGAGNSVSPLDLQTGGGSGAGVLHVAGGLTLKGAVLPMGDAAGSTLGQIFFDGGSPQTLDGTAANPGTVLFGSNGQNGLLSNAGSFVTYGPNLTITGAAGNVSGFQVGFDVQGTVAADPAAVGSGPVANPLVLDGAGWTNHGALLARNGGALVTRGTVTNFSAGTLTGGTWGVFANSTLRLLGGNVTTNAADLILDGANSNFFSDPNSTDALANFATNAAAGSFTVRNGRNFTAAGAFTNAGDVIADGGTFTATGAYTQTGGTTTLAAGGVLASTANLVSLQGGTLRGTGTVNADLGNAATVSPGLSPGVLTVTGNYTQTAAGVLAVELAGTSAAASDFDQLHVTGSAALAGTLNVTVLGPFQPAAGDTFPVLTFGSASGDFTTKTGFLLGSARFLAERFTPTALNLDAKQAVLAYQTQPVDSLAGASIPVVVRVTDGAGNTLTFDGVDKVTLTLNQNTFADGTTSKTLTVANGVAAFTVTINQPATGYQLTAGGNGFAGVASNPFNVQLPASLTSTGSATFLAGAANTFTVTATGVPTPAITESGPLPVGVTFTDNGNATATLVGTPAPGSGGVYALGLTANNGVGTAPTQTFTLTVNEAAAVTSANHATFSVGSAGAFTVTTFGFPVPTISDGGFALPAGVSFTDHGDGTATLAGTPTGTVGGVYTFTITAQNGIGATAAQTFALTVNQELAVTSPDHATFVELGANSFTITAIGFPTAALSMTGALPAGVTFTDNGNGTATLSGSPAALTSGVYPLTITASNGVGPDAVQPFTLTVSQTVQPPAVVSGAAATFTAGTPGAFTVTATGAPVPTLTRTGALPAGVSFVDNGNGTATLSGTPAAGTGGAYSFTVTASNGVGGDAAQTFALTVREAAAVTSANAATFTVGTAGAFTATAAGFPTAALVLMGALPAGVSFADNGDGTATLSGTPAAGTGGTYLVTVTASNGVGAPGAQTFTLTVNQAPAITGGNAATFTAGSAGTFTATATGFPAPTFTATGALPAGVTLSAAGVLGGTPAPGTGGVYTFTIAASNGVGASAVQRFTLTVRQPAAITSGNAASFLVGSVGTFLVTTTGFPTAALGAAGALPTGVTFTDLGNGTARLAGTPAAGTAGSYAITLTAANGVGADAVQPFTLTVTRPAQAPAITSAAATAFTVGAAGDFTITATGLPAPALSAAGALPPGVAFRDNGDGTATLAGTPAAGAGGTYPLTITASGDGSATQLFTLTVNQSPTIAAAGTATFTVGSAGMLIVTATGFPSPGLSVVGALPEGVTFTDNGNGTATLGGTPAAGTAGTYPLTLTAANDGGADTRSLSLVVTAPVVAAARVDQNEFGQFVLSGGASAVALNPDGSAFGAPAAPFSGGTTRAVLADLTGDGTADLVVGSGPGTAARVVVIDGATRQVVAIFAPFEASFAGGTFVAAGDADGDGRAEVAVAADDGGAARVVVFDGRTGARVADFFGIADPAFRGGARVAMGDVNGDGRADLAVAAGSGGGPRVALFDGVTLGSAPARLVGDFFAFEPALRDGAFVSVGDVTGDGSGDLVAGAGAGGSPRVLVVSGHDLLADGPAAAVRNPVANYFAADPAGRDGVRVAVKDLDGDRFADLVAAVPSAAGVKVLGYRGSDLTAPGRPAAFAVYSDSADPQLSGVFVG